MEEDSFVASLLDFQGTDLVHCSFESLDDVEDDVEEEIRDDLAANLEAIHVDDELEEPKPPVRKRAAKFQGPFLAETYKWLEQSEMASESTEKKFRPIWGYWKGYCESIHRSTEVLPMFGLNLYEKRSKEQMQNSEVYDREVTDGFFKYLVENCVGKSVLGTAKTFLNTNLKCEHHNRQKLGDPGYAHLVEVKVGESIRVKKQVALSNKLASGRSLQRCDDLQAELDEYISPKKNREMLLFAFKPKEGGKVQKLSPSYRLIFGCAKNLLDSTLRRGEELKPQRMVQRSQRSVMHVGPRPEGTVDETIITNKAKHNKEGRLEVTKALPHYDPLKCSSAWHGLYLTQRIVAENEAFPDWLGDDYQAIYNIRTYKADRSQSHIDDKEFSQCYKAHFHDASVVCMAVCHISRHQGTDEMDKKQLPEAIQRRMTGHKGKGVTVQQRSYNRAPPVAGLVERAGGDPFKVKEFDPPLWNRLPREEELLKQLSRLLMPKLVDDYEEISRRFFLTGSVAERKEKRLCTIRGTMGWILYCVEQMFLMLACPLLDPVTHKLSGDKRSLWEIHKADSLSYILMLPPFQSVHFMELQQSVVAKMERAEMVVPMTDGNDVHRQQCIMMQQAKDMLSAMKTIESRALGKRCHNGLIPVPVSPANSTETEATSVFEEDELLADGKTKRRRKQGIRQQDLISAEYQRRLLAGEGAGSTLHVLCDKHCVTFDDHMHYYFHHLVPLERATNGEWRKDIPTSVNGKKTRNRSQWFTHRRAKFHCYEHLKEKHGHEEAMRRCREKFDSVPPSKGGTRAVKSVSKAFKAYEIELGIWSKGRPAVDSIFRIRGGGLLQCDASLANDTVQEQPRPQQNRNSLLPRPENPQRVPHYHLVQRPIQHAQRREQQQQPPPPTDPFMREFEGFQLNENVAEMQRRRLAEHHKAIAKERQRRHQDTGDYQVGGGQMFDDVDRCFIGKRDSDVGMVSANTLADLSRHNRENRGRFVEAQYHAETGGLDAAFEYNSVYDSNGPP